jgi:dTDP-4-amino-4,6-dideoxygalactose transaminase
MRRDIPADTAWPQQGVPAVAGSRSSIDDLAILGGAPLYDVPLHVGRPNIGDRARFFERLNEVLDARWLTNNGRFVREFEDRLADYLQVGHCVAVCNATIGLEIAARALGLQGEVIVPSFTFVATAHALQWLGLTPVFCDIDAATHNIDPACAASLVTERTSAIVGVHVWGRPCDVEALQRVASDHHLNLVFDAAHALGCTHRGTPIGNFGDAEVFSFHATKVMNAFEGGAICTNDAGLANQLRLMRNFGFTGYDSVEVGGTNAKMTEVSAAMGITSLESIDAFIDANHRNHRLYREQLAGVPGLRVVAYPDGERSNYQYVIVEVDAEQTGVSRDLLVRVLHAENILARRYFYPGCHQMKPYAERANGRAEMPNTEHLAARAMALPTGTTIGPEDIAAICTLIRLSLEQGRELAERLVSWNGRLLHG